MFNALTADRGRFRFRLERGFITELSGSLCTIDSVEKVYDSLIQDLVGGPRGSSVSFTVQCGKRWDSRIILTSVQKIMIIIVG